MNSEIFNRFKAFIVVETGVEEEEVTADASLEDDLGVYGDDAVDLIIEFGKEFKVDVSRFMAADYFSGEGSSIFSSLIRLFTGAERKKLKKLTPRHLEQAVRAGRLDEEVINGLMINE